MERVHLGAEGQWNPIPEERYWPAVSDLDGRSSKTALEDVDSSDKAYADSTSEGDSAMKADTGGVRADDEASTSAALGDVGAEGGAATD